MDAFGHVLNELDQKVTEAEGASSLTLPKGFQILAMSFFKWLNNLVKYHPNGFEMAFFAEELQKLPSSWKFSPLDSFC